MIPETKGKEIKNDIKDEEFDIVEVVETEWYQEDEVCISSDGDDEAVTNFDIPCGMEFKSFISSPETD